MAHERPHVYCCRAVLHLVNQEARGHGDSPSAPMMSVVMALRNLGLCPKSLGSDSSEWLVNVNETRSENEPLGIQGCFPGFGTNLPIATIRLPANPHVRAVERAPVPSATLCVQNHLSDCGVVWG